MAKTFKVFIDGKEGTTGLKIYERFAKRSDIEILQIDEDKRKNPEEKKKLIDASDFTFLCLPDAAAIESAALCTNSHTTIIDASTAHRTNPEWAYGFPELSAKHREAIANSKRNTFAVTSHERNLPCSKWKGGSGVNNSQRSLKRGSSLAR